jgi:hypothetical protein
MVFAKGVVKLRNRLTLQSLKAILRQSNMAWEILYEWLNIIRTSLHGGLSIAAFDCQRVLFQCPCQLAVNISVLLQKLYVVLQSLRYMLWLQDNRASIVTLWFALFFSAGNIPMSCCVCIKHDTTRRNRYRFLLF